jgi:hypothetical protein
MRVLRYILSLLVIVAGAVWVWTRYHIPCLEPPTAWTQKARQREMGLPPPFAPTPMPPKQPPFAGLGGIQQRWDDSDLACTGSAEEPIRTGLIETLDGSDRDQLMSWVMLETCFKGKKPDRQIQVLGDSVFAEKDIHGGFAYVGPAPGFVTHGRNLLFLRKTERPGIWRVTVPVYAICIQLADAPPSYTLDGSEDSIRHALVAEMEAMIGLGELRPSLGAIQIRSREPDRIAAEYLPYILEILGETQGLGEFARLMEVSPQAVRREVAMALLREGDQRGQPDTLALLEDTSLPDWQRANAARALELAKSTRARSVPERIAREPGNQELRHAAAESLSRMRQ